MKKSCLLIILIQSIILFICIPAAAISDDTSFDLGFTNFECAPAGSPGNTLYAWFAVENTGTQISMTNKVSIYLSHDQDISISDYLIGETEISFIRPEGSIEKGVQCTIPENVPPGTYYAGAVLNIKFGLVPDANEEDNTIIGNNVTISRGYGRSQEWYNSLTSDLVLTYTNQERLKRNLAELTRDSDLDAIALSMSRDMGNRRFFDHVNPSGEDPVDRAERFGYNQHKNLPDGSAFYGIGENIVKIPVGSVFRYGEISPDDPNQVATVAIKSFMDSPPHKSTLLLPEYEKIGIGTAFDGKNYYITQNFF